MIGGFCVFLFWVGLWVVLAGLPQKAADAAREGFYAKTAAAGFVVEDILVEGRDQTDADILLALLNIRRGDPLFSFHPASARKMVEQIAWVEKARVERRFPDTVYVRLTERKPFALWQHDGRVRLIDRHGVVLTERGLKEYGDMLILVGEKAPEQAGQLEELLTLAPALTERVDAATWVGGRRWDIRLKSGAMIKLPEKDAAYALNRLVKQHETEGILDKRLKVIDIRGRDRIVVQTFPGTTVEYDKSVKAGSNI